MDAHDENARHWTKPQGFVGDRPKAAASEAMGERKALRELQNLGGTSAHRRAFSKKEIPDKKSAAERKIPNPVAVNRPITRGFAATLKSQIQQDLNFASSHTSGPDDCVAIDIDQIEKQTDDEALPMVDGDDMDNCEHDVVEMIDDSPEDEIPMDIDSADVNNPLAVVEYIDELHCFYRQTEISSCVIPNYMSNQIDINEKMRAILIDWLIEVHYKFELMDETLFLTVNLIDRFLSCQSVVRKKLQLVGVTAMLLACKYEEVSVPVVADLILISDRAYTRDQVLEMEKLMVNTLQFNMSLPTAYVFMRRFLKAARSDQKMELLSFFLIELCLVQYEMLKFKPSMLAAAAVYTAQSTLKGFKHWNKTCESHSHYREDQLLECSRMMVHFHVNAGSGKLTGVHRKYSTYKYGFAARSAPALFLLDAA